MAERQQRGEGGRESACERARTCVNNVGYSCLKNIVKPKPSQSVANESNTQLTAKPPF